MKHILLPTDFSDNAWNALFAALKLYADVPCHFYLLNAHEPSFANLLGDKGKQRLAVIYDSMEEYSNQELNKVLDYLKENHSNTKHTFEKVSRTDDLVSAIQEILLKKDMDLIIMGTKGATGAKEVFMGSNAVKVIKAIRNRPVMVIPESYDFQILEKIIFPTDFTQFFEPFELGPLIELTLLWKAHIAVFQVALEFQPSDSQKVNKTLLDKRLADTNHSFHEVTMKEDITKGIHDFAKENEAGMIALVHYRHTFLEKLTREPVVKKVAFHSKIPLLVLPELS